MVAVLRLVATAIVAASFCLALVGCGDKQADPNAPVANPTGRTVSPTADASHPHTRTLVPLTEMKK
jgi:uncharacterized lipoprotein YehR (DUF1307 family)